MNKSVLSTERQAELSTCQNALKAPLLRARVGKGSRDKKKTLCHQVAGASLELPLTLCKLFSLEAQDLPTCLYLSAANPTHSNNRKIPPRPAQ